MYENYVALNNYNVWYVIIPNPTQPNQTEERDSVISSIWFFKETTLI